MNPRHRRLLIPGLLICLVVVAAVASLAGKADAAEQDAAVVSVIDDPRVTEASGMAVSRAHDDLVYVINDSGHDEVVYAVRLSTGEVVGTTTVQAVTWADTEALSITADGTLWVADTGDNLRRRDDIALYTFPEPGPGDHAVSATRYPVTLPDGPDDIEALLIDPLLGRVALVGKGLLGGSLYWLPPALDERGNDAEVWGTAPGMVTDGAYSEDGSEIFLRTYTTVHRFDVATGEVVGAIATPWQQQAESLAVEAGGRSLLLGTEGRPAPIVRVPVPGRTVPAPTSTASRPSASASPQPPESAQNWWLAGGVAAGAALGLVLVRRA